MSADEVRDNWHGNAHGEIERCHAFSGAVSPTCLLGSPEPKPKCRLRYDANDGIAGSDGRSYSRYFRVEPEAGMRELPLVVVVATLALERIAELLRDDFGCEHCHSAHPLQTGGGPMVQMGLTHFAVEPPGQFELTPPPPLPAASALTVETAVTTAAKAILESKVERVITKYPFSGKCRFLIRAQMRQNVQI